MNKGAIPTTIYLNLALWETLITDNHNLADQQHDDDSPDNETEVAQDEPLYCFIRFNIGHLIILI